MPGPIQAVFAATSRIPHALPVPLGATMRLGDTSDATIAGADQKVCVGLIRRDSVGGASWLAAEGTLTALGICARSISPFFGFHELRDAAQRRDAPAVSENADWPRLRLFVVDRAESCVSGALKAPGHGAIGTVIQGGIGAMTGQAIDALADQFVAPQKMSALLARVPVLAAPASSPPSQPGTPALGWFLSSSARVLRGLAALIVLLLFAHISWAGPNRSVGVLYDDSSSMKSPVSRWLGANFSLQVMASLLSEGDELFLVKMNAQPKPRRYEMPADTDALLSDLTSEPTPSGKTPYTGIGELLNALQSSKASQKWLLVVTDGEFTTFSPELAQQQIDAVVKPQGIRVVFLLIERRGDFKAARYWQSAAGATIVDAASGADVPKRMEEIAAMLTGRDPDGISLKRDGDDFVLSSLFPLRGLVTLVQGGSGVRVAGAAAGQTAMTLRGHAARARLRHPDIPQAGHVAHMLAKDGIAAGDQVVRIRLSGAIGRDRIKVFPEVAARMEVTVIDAAGKPIPRNAQGVHSVCRDDDIEFRTRFVGPDGNAITIGRSDIATFDVGLFQSAGAPLRSTIAPNQNHFNSRIKPTDELRLTPFGRYPGYFSYQGDVIHLRTVECKREVVVALDSNLNAEGIWSEGVERLETAAPLAFRVTIDGTPATEAELKTWIWRTDQDARWTLQVKGEKLLLSPIGGCCVAIWSRPQAHRGELKFQGLDTGTATDKVRWPAPVVYTWTLPENVVARLWWLYGCPLAALAGIIAFALYLWRILVTKERFGRRAAVHVLKDRKHDTMWLCRAGDLPTRWLWPSRRETKRVGTLRFMAVRKGGSEVLVSGKGLTQRHEVDGWDFDEQLQAQKKPQRDALLRDQSMIIRRTGTGHRARDIGLQMQYAQRGQPPNWPR